MKKSLIVIATLAALTLTLASCSDAGDATTTTPTVNDGTEETVLAEKPVKLGTKWAANGVIPKEKLANVTTDSVFTFTISLDSEGDGYHQLQICDGDWKTLPDLAKTLKANDYGCIEITKNTPITFSLSESDLATAKKSGIIYKGYAITVSKVTVK